MESDEIRGLLQRINDAWLKGPPDQIPAVLENCFGEAMVIKGPGFQTMGDGKQHCIQGYVDFVRQAAVRDCTFSEPEIHISGDTAVATYLWRMTYELSGEQYRESGHDVFVFARAAGRWLAVWRAMLPETQE